MSAPMTSQEHRRAAEPADGPAAAAASSPTVPPRRLEFRGAPLPYTIALTDTLLFLWCGRLVSLARRNKRLDAGDAHASLPAGAHRDIDAQLSKGPAWVHTAPLPAPVTTFSIFMNHRCWMVLRAALATTVVGIRLTTPIMLRGFVKFLDTTDKAIRAAKAVPSPAVPPAVPPLWQGWLWAAGLVGFSILSIIMDAVNTWNTQAHSNTLRMQIGAALSAKSLRLGGAELATRFGAGRVLNGFSSDARRVSELNTMMEYFVSAPVVTLIAAIMIGLEAGPAAALASISVYIIALPLVFWWSHLIAKLRSVSAAAADERLRLLEECLVGIAAVKALKAEGDIEQRIQAARRREMRALRKIAIFKALNYSLQYVTTPIAALALFTIQFYMHPNMANGGLNGSVVFYALALLSLPEFYLLRMFVRCWQRLQEYYASRDRLDAFFLHPEPPPPPAERWLAANPGAGGGGTPGDSGAPPLARVSRGGGGGGGSSGAGAGVSNGSGRSLAKRSIGALSSASVASESTVGAPSLVAGVGPPLGAVELKGGSYVWPGHAPEDCGCEGGAQLDRAFSVEEDADDEAGTVSLMQPFRLSIVVRRDEAHSQAAAAAAAAGAGGPSSLRSPSSITASGGGSATSGAGGAFGDGAFDICAPALSGVRLALKPGELLGVCGSTAAGKTSLLACLLGELDLAGDLGAEPSLSNLAGFSASWLAHPAAGGGGAAAAEGGDGIWDYNGELILVAGRTAFLPQTPWVAFGTLRDNITLAASEEAAAARRGRRNQRAAEAAFYNRVVEACALTNDLLTLTAGDLTPLGDGGSTLSGGQAARLGLARCAYSRAAIQLLDDPLSAVDPRVAAHLFDRCIGGPAALMKGATRVLVTHQVQFLPRCDRIAVLRNGHLVAVGTWHELAHLNLPELSQHPEASGAAAHPAAAAPGLQHGGSPGAADPSEVHLGPLGRPVLPRTQSTSRRSSAAGAVAAVRTSTPDSGLARGRLSSALSRVMSVEDLLFKSPELQQLLARHGDAAPPAVPDAAAGMMLGGQLSDIPGMPSDGMGELGDATGMIEEGDEEEEEESSEDGKAKEEEKEEVKRKGRKVSYFDDGKESDAEQQTTPRGGDMRRAHSGLEPAASSARSVRVMPSIRRSGTGPVTPLLDGGTALLDTETPFASGAASGAAPDSPTGAAAGEPHPSQADAGEPSGGPGLPFTGSAFSPFANAVCQDKSYDTASCTDDAGTDEAEEDPSPGRVLRAARQYSTLAARTAGSDPELRPTPFANPSAQHKVRHGSSSAASSHGDGAAEGGQPLSRTATHASEGASRPASGAGTPASVARQKSRRLWTDLSVVSFVFRTNSLPARLAPASSCGGAHSSGALPCDDEEVDDGIGPTRRHLSGGAAPATRSAGNPAVEGGSGFFAWLPSSLRGSGGWFREFGSGTGSMVVSRETGSRSHGTKEPSGRPKILSGIRRLAASSGGSGPRPAPAEPKQLRFSNSTDGRGDGPSEAPDKSGSSGSKASSTPFASHAGSGAGSGRAGGGPPPRPPIGPTPSLSNALYSSGSVMMSAIAARGRAAVAALMGRPVGALPIAPAKSVPLNKRGDPTNWIAPPQLARTNVRREEEVASGGVAWRVYGSLVRASLPPVLTLALTALVISPLISLLANLLLAQWANNSPHPTVIKLAFGYKIPIGWKHHWVVRYAGLVAINVACTILGFLLAFMAMTRGASKIHDGALVGVLHAPLSFFAANSAGSVLNRFSGDQRAVDDDLPETLVDLWAGLMTQVASFVLAIIAFPPVTAAIVPSLALLWWLRAQYLRASAQAQRLEATARSPVLARMRAVVEGLITIRAFGPAVRQRMQAGILEAYSAALEWSLATRALQRWLGVRLESLVLMVTAMMAFATMGLISKISASILGLALTKLTSTLGALSWVVRQSAELENSMTSVERMLNYSTTRSEVEELSGPPPPPPAKKRGKGKGGGGGGGGDGGRDEGDDYGWEAATYKGAKSVVAAAAPGVVVVPEGWPATGAVTFANVTARYQPGLRPVLAGVSFDLKPGQIMGVVGRTGSGKSTLLLALFRLLRTEGGHITLDGVDTSAIPVDRLRAHLALIPQAPLLFSGSVRSNLDPTNTLAGRGVQDAAIWRLLGEVGLADIVRGIGGLDAPLPTGGSALSLGQRQVFSLVRAVLRGAHVLAIDEGTANLDASTDATIQAALDRLRHKCSQSAPPCQGSPRPPRHHAASGDDKSGVCGGFMPEGCALIVVAHRLETVAHTDNLLVMSQGRVLEQGPPAALAEAPRGVYATMLRAMREAQAAAAAYS